MDARMLKRLGFKFEENARYSQSLKRDMDEWSKELSSDFLLCKLCPGNEWFLEHDGMILPLKIETAEELEVFVKVVI